MRSATPEAGSIGIGGVSASASVSVNDEAKKGVCSDELCIHILQPRKTTPRRNKTFEDATDGVRQLLDRIEEPHQRHRGVDDIADHKIDLLNINWQLFNDFASTVNLQTPPFQLPRRKVDSERQVLQDQASGIVTQLFVLRQNE